MPCKHGTVEYIAEVCTLKGMHNMRQTKLDMYQSMLGRL